MNLWVKCLGQLAMLAVALFFYSCEEESSVLGYKNPNSKFKVSYVEIPIESSVLLRDSLRTTNFTYASEPNRFLIGRYFDDVFGDISTVAFTQYFAAKPLLTVGSTAVYDSVTLELQFDFYHYGASAVTPQTISVYELDEELKPDSVRTYSNESSVAYSTTIGSKTFSVNTSTLDDFAKENIDTVITITVPLDFNFGHRIFNSNVKFRDATSESDSTFVKYSEFVKEFKGIAIKPETADKVIGFNPASTRSRIIIHYHETDKDSLYFDMGFSGLVGFNQINSNRIGTVLEPIKPYYKDALQDDENRYIQSGVGILTKLDFSKFYEFTDTVPYLLINSAELSIESVQQSNFAPPSSLSLRILDANTNRMKKFSTKNTQSATDIKDFGGYLRYDIGFQSSPAVVDNDSVFYAADKNLALNYSSTNNSYNMGMSLFLQKLAAPPTETRTRFRTFVLHPGAESTAQNSDAQSGLKTVNRVIFPKDKIKLKIYYTKPTSVQ